MTSTNCDTRRSPDIMGQGRPVVQTAATSVRAMESGCLKPTELADELSAVSEAAQTLDSLIRLHNHQVSSTYFQRSSGVIKHLACQDG